MTATTPTYGIPYPEATDPPNGPAQMQALALEVEAEITRVDTTAAANTTAANARAKGVKGSTPIGTSASANTTGIITDSVTFTAEAGRAYRVNVLTPVIDNDASASQTAVVSIRWAAGASVAITDALIAKAVQNTPPTTTSNSPGSAAETVAMVAYLNNPAAGQVTVGVGLAALSASSTIRFLASGTSGPNANGVFVVEDVGPAY
jgi:hypothetical protein